MKHNTQFIVQMAQLKDKSAIEEIWKYCFKDGDSFREWYFKEYYDTGECIVAYDDIRPIASLQVIKTYISIQGNIIKAGYIVGVDCLPEYRGQGITHSLMEEALFSYAKKEQIAFMMLMPFEADFYLKYGFVFGTYHQNMVINIDEFYNKDVRTLKQIYRWMDVFGVSDSQLKKIIPQLYQKWGALFDGFVMREERHWNAFVNDLMIENGYMKVLYNQEGEAVGYIAYLLQDDQIFIKEMVYMNEDARNYLYYFIASHRSQVKKVEWSAPEGEAIVYTRKKDKNSVAFYPFMMYLILDPTILSLFATKLPDKDLYFSVDGCGTYLWKAQSSYIEMLNEDINKSAYVWSLEGITRMVFECSFFNKLPEKHSEQKLTELFTKKLQIFNNEYF